jgi:hypothetical protein
VVIHGDSVSSGTRVLCGRLVKGVIDSDDDDDDDDGRGPPPAKDDDDDDDDDDDVSKCGQRGLLCSECASEC